MLGEQFMVGNEICGAVVSVRFQVGSSIDQYFHYFNNGWTFLGGFHFRLEQNLL
jgi:hypothetical protein